jgi:hypothetical protein
MSCMPHALPSITSKAHTGPTMGQVTGVGLFGCTQLAQTLTVWTSRHTRSCNPYSQPYSQPPNSHCLQNSGHVGSDTAYPASACRTLYWVLQPSPHVHNITSASRAHAPRAPMHTRRPYAGRHTAISKMKQRGHSRAFLACPAAPSPTLSLLPPSNQQHQSAL